MSNPPKRFYRHAVKAIYSPRREVFASRIISDLEKHSIRFNKQKTANSNSHDEFSTLLVFASDDLISDARMRLMIEKSRLADKDIIAIYFPGVIPEQCESLLFDADEYVAYSNKEDHLVKRLVASQGIRNCRAESSEPYEGVLDYAFVSYAHKDSQQVLPVINNLQARGFRIWYDPGIEIGSKWKASLEQHLAQCTIFICFQSSNYRASKWCRQELAYALKNKEGHIIAVALDPDEKSSSFPKELYGRQGLFRHDFDSDSALIDKLADANLMQPCKDEYELDANGTLLVRMLSGNTDPQIPCTVTDIAPGAVIAPNARSMVLPGNVETIEFGAFAGCARLEDLTLPASLRHIEEKAFDRCTSLRKILFPPSVEIIERAAFSDCISLREVSFSSGGKLECIEELAFGGCTSLQSVSLPSGLMEIGAFAFYNCKSLSSIALHHSVESIGESAFGACTSLISIVLPPNLTYLGTRAFEACESLQEIAIPYAIEELEPLVFADCKSLQSISCPNSLKMIGKRSFSGCCSLKLINLPQSLLTIEEEAFDGCRSLVAVDIPEGVVSIGDRAFRGCASLLVVRIPDSLESLGVDAFCGCESAVFYRSEHTSPLSYTEFMRVWSDASGSDSDVEEIYSLLDELFGSS